MILEFFYQNSSCVKGLLEYKDCFFFFPQQIKPNSSFMKTLRFDLGLGKLLLNTLMKTLNKNIMLIRKHHSVCGLSDKTVNRSLTHQINQVFGCFKCGNTVGNTK